MKTEPFDAMLYLMRREAQSELLDDAKASGDRAYIVHAHRLVARARQITSLTTDD